VCRLQLPRPAYQLFQLAFNRRIIDATADLAAAYKPQIAFYSALGKETELVASIRYIRERAPHALIILDAKRSDIGNTAEAYASEAFDRYGADAVTVNPYMGEDSVRPFLARPDRGAILLCRTSNPGARDFQDLLVDGLPVKELAEYNQRAIVGGDGLSVTIAAGSIIAKVTRDRIMVAAHETYPEYGFDKHKGYCCAQHMSALTEHGPCPIHRQSFAPVANWRRLL